jgi:hypothetical protein
MTWNEFNKSIAKTVKELMKLIQDGTLTPEEQNLWIKNKAAHAYRSGFIPTGKRSPQPLSDRGIWEAYETNPDMHLPKESSDALKLLLIREQLWRHAYDSLKQAQQEANHANE